MQEARRRVEVACPARADSDAMTGQRTAVVGCSAPEQGRALEDYLDRRLSQEAEAAFENHYFMCPACLEEIRIRQALPQALVFGESGSVAPASAPPSPVATVPRERRRLPSWVPYAAAAAIVAAVAGIGLFFQGLRLRPPSPKSAVILNLEGTYRGGQETLGRAPVDMPLELVIFVPVPEGQPVLYDVELTGPERGSVRQFRDLPPSGLDQVRVRIPRGVRPPGLYSVRVTERGSLGAEPLTFTYMFEAVASAE